METLSLEKFNPTTAELTIMADKYKILTIKGVEDMAGYLEVDRARKELKKAKSQIRLDGKLLRSEALAFQKAVIKKEDELVGIIEPIEDELEAKQKAIDVEKEKVGRLQFLPHRVTKLATIGIKVMDEFLLLMDDTRFLEFFNEENFKFLEAREQKQNEELEAREQKLKEAQDQIDEANRKIEAEKEKIADDKRHQLEIDQARVEATAKAKKEAEEKAEKDKTETAQKIKDEENRKAKEAQDKIKAEKLEQEKLEKKKRYQAFLTEHKFQEDGSFLIKKEENKIVLYKKLGEFKI